MTRLTNREDRMKKIAETKRQKVLAKIPLLREAARIGGNAKEQRFHADIPSSTYYDLLKEYPEVADELEVLRARPNLKSKMIIATRLENNDVEAAYWQLEHYDEEIRASKLKVEHGGKVDVTVDMPTLTPEMLAIKDKYESEFYKEVMRAWDKKKPNENPQ